MKQKPKDLWDGYYREVANTFRYCQDSGFLKVEQWKNAIEPFVMLFLKVDELKGQEGYAKGKSDTLREVENLKIICRSCQGDIGSDREVVFVEDLTKLKLEKEKEE